MTDKSKAVPEDDLPAPKPVPLSTAVPESDLSDEHFAQQYRAQDEKMRQEGAKYQNQYNPDVWGTAGAVAGAAGKISADALPFIGDVAHNLRYGVPSTGSLQRYSNSQLGNARTNVPLAEIERLTGMPARTTSEIQDAIKVIKTQGIDISAYEKKYGSKAAQSLMSNPWLKAAMESTPGKVLAYGAKTLMPAAALGGGAYEGVEAWNRAQEGDIPGAVIAGTGALGNLAMMAPHPIAKIIGGGLAIGAPFALDYLDKSRQVQNKAAGGSIQGYAPGGPTEDDLGKSEPSLAEAWDNITKGLTSKKQLTEAGQGIKKMAGYVPNVAESLARGAVAQIPGTPGDINDLIVNHIGSAFPNAPKPYTTEQILQKVPRVTPEYENASSHEIVGGLIGPALGKLTKADVAAKKTAEFVAPNLEEALFRYTNKLTGGMSPSLRSDLTTWHGSPHTYDKFDLSKIGTGEGAQSYGHGIYVAEKPKTAIEYQRKLSGDNPLTTEELAQYWEPGSIRKSYAGHDRVIGFDPENQLVTVQRVQKSPEGEWVNSKEPPRVHRTVPSTKEFEEATGVKRPPAGNLYKVDLPDEHIATMLDWDRPLMHQNEHVKNALWDIEEKLGKTFTSQSKGESIYELIGKALQNSNPDLTNKQASAQAAKMLNEHGIAGVKYLDAGSRPHMPSIRPVEVDGKTVFEVKPGWSTPNQTKFFDTLQEATKHAYSIGTRNFVVFDPDKTTKIIERNPELNLKTNWWE